MSEVTAAKPIFAGPLRRLGAMVYDALLSIAVLMVVTGLFLPFTQGEAVTTMGTGVLYIYRVAMAVALIGFFVVFWTTKGRTLGMQAWSLRIEGEGGAHPSWGETSVRVLAAMLPSAPALTALVFAVQPGAAPAVRSVGFWLFVLVPLNYAFAWIDPQRRALHDRLLTSRIVHRK
ncbi:MAG TPA: RDD family protein [Steroidobacteraceae bacterium]|nr:RDD family protein [Steroidobacteraceae bacterium]